MPYLLMLAALAMPTIAWLSQRGVFGPDNAQISDRYPTLLIAAGGAFSIWGLIFLLDLVVAAWQLGRARRNDDGLRRMRPSAALGFALCAAWMILFSQQLFVTALVVIWAALGCLLLALLQAAAAPGAAARPLVRTALGLHAGWLSLAVFLNTAQAIVAQGWLPVSAMLTWSLVLWALAAALLLGVNHRLGGGVAGMAYAGAALWGLGGVVIEQGRGSLPGSHASATIAGLLMLVLLAQTAWLRQRGPGRTPAGNTDPWAGHRPPHAERLPQ